MTEKTKKAPLDEYKDNIKKPKVKKNIKKEKKRNTWKFHLFNSGLPCLRTFLNIHKWARSGTGVNHQRHLVDRHVMVSSHSFSSHEILDLSASPLLTIFCLQRERKKKIGDLDLL